MFKKNECKKCRKKISDRYEFCPYCGNSLNENFKNEDWGMLGKNDFLEEQKQFANPSFGGGLLGKILGSAMKMFEKELQKEMQTSNFQPRTNFELIINGKRVDPKNIRVSRQIMKKPIRKQPTKPSQNFSQQQLKRISKLSKEEPSTSIRRFSDKVIYEINVPGVKEIKDISIIKLENSIEIKAIAKDKYYFKSIPINLPLINYNLSEGKLVLELGVKN